MLLTTSADLINWLIFSSVFVMTSYTHRVGDAVGVTGGTSFVRFSFSYHTQMFIPSSSSSFLLLLLTPTFTNFHSPTLLFFQPFNFFNSTLNQPEHHPFLSLHHPSLSICTGISHLSRTAFGPNLHVVMDGSSARRMNDGRGSSPTTLSLLSTFMRSQQNGRICRCCLNHSANLFVSI